MRVLFPGLLVMSDYDWEVHDGWIGLAREQMKGLARRKKGSSLFISIVNNIVKLIGARSKVVASSDERQSVHHVSPSKSTLIIDNLSSPHQTIQLIFVSIVSERNEVSLYQPAMAQHSRNWRRCFIEVIQSRLATSLNQPIVHMNTTFSRWRQLQNRPLIERAWLFDKEERYRKWRQCWNLSWWVWRNIEMESLVCMSVSTQHGIMDHSLSGETWWIERKTRRRKDGGD